MMPTLKTTWNDTMGLASASQVVGGTLSPVVVANESWTAPRPGRKFHVTQVIDQTHVRRSRDIKFSRVKRRRKTASKKSRLRAVRGN
jgi:hypothetical protein